MTSGVASLELRLAGRIALVPTRGLAAKVAEQRRQGRQIPHEADLIKEIRTLNQNGGVPAVRDQKWLRLYAHRHVLGLGPSKNGDAWMIAWVEPLSLSDYDRMARGMLRIYVTGSWSYEPLLSQLPPGCDTYQRSIDEAWRQLPPPDRDRNLRPTEPARPEHHDGFCDALDGVINAARRIEEAKQTLPPVPYFAVESTTGGRQSTAARYVFRLARATRLAVGTWVQVRGVPDLQGTAQTQDGDRLTVGFTNSVDRGRIPSQGELEVTVNLRIQQIQREAVERLRSNRTHSPWLLPILADRALPSVMPAGGGTPADPGPDLDPGQAKAFRRALARPQLLLVHGPPGTGKTRTIGDIARACVARGERVLVCSQTNVAVDNVVERLPADVLVVRVGREERVAASVQYLTLPNLAASVRERILMGTAPRMDRLAPWRDPHGLPSTLLGRMVGAIDVAERSHREYARATHALAAARTAVETRHAPAHDAAEAAVAAARAEHTRQQARLAGATAAHTRALARARGWWGFWFRRRARATATRQAKAQEELHAAARKLDRAEQARTAASQAWEAARRQDPEVRQAQARAGAAEARHRDGLAGAVRIAQELHRMVAAESVAAPAPDLPGLAEFRDRCQRLRAQLKERAALLHEWRERLAQADENLHEELIRYADVVGSTCIGVGVQANRIADQEFDVAIVDEAAQISLPATLVALVRVRRAILVGDPQQLPPFVDEDVAGYLERYPGRDRTDRATLKDLLTSSIFELFYRAGGQAHTVMLTHQRRMPSSVADFVSRSFYNGRLVSRVTRTPPGSLFHSCLALVDTSDQPAKARHERTRPKSETWQVAGCDNLTEANLIVDLVEWCLRTKLTWGVIVPYRAQVQLVRARLGMLVSDAQLVSDNLGTVDAFQGGERDIILFGFTRSNDNGRIGFLRELRRLNVAITRARQQLVLIGDFTTLRAADDRRFAETVNALYTHAQHHGEVSHSLDLRTRVRQLAPEQL